MRLNDCLRSEWELRGGSSMINKVEVNTDTRGFILIHIWNPVNSL